MIDRNEYRHINTQIGISPIKFNVALASINSRGTLGELNLYVLKELGYENSIVEEIDLSKGYFLLNNNRNKPILFVVTVGNKENSGMTLQRNLRNAISSNEKFLISKNVWVPLMATGAGGLSFVDSYDTVVGVLKYFQHTNFTIAVPNNKTGVEFVKLFRVDNLQEDLKRNKGTESDFINENNDTVKEYSNENDIVEKLRKDSKDIISILKNRNFFLAGHLWGDEDQMPRFIEQHIWENGHDTNDTTAVNQAEKNDIVFIKTTYAKNGISYLRIKAIGVVRENKLDGHNLDVNWHQFKSVNIEDLGKYRRTFQSVNPDDVETILIAIFENHPNLLAIVEELSTRVNDSINEEIKSPEEQKNEAQKITTFAGLLSDADSGADYLDIAKDVNAFAKVMSAKSFNPPLAIALLGKWGSGKSFFMRKLKERIEQLSNSNTTQQVYCNGIAHVHFNAWSYMDANLWAGVITKIFEGLQEYITNDSIAKEKKDVIAKALNQKLNIAQGEINNLEHRKNSIDEKIKALEATKKEIEDSLKQKINQIKTKSVKTVLQNLDNSFHLSDKIENVLSSNESYIKTEEQLDKIVPKEYWQNPINLYQKLNDKRAYLRMFFKGRGAERNLVWLCIIILGIFAIKIALFFLIPELGRLDFTFPDKFLYFISITGAFIYRNYSTVKHLQPLISKFWKIKEDYELQKKDALFKLGQQEKALRLEIENYKEEIQTVNEQINKAQQSKLEIEYKLKHTQTTEALFTFIEKRSSSDDYKKHLGIISIIRKDFEILSELFSGHQEEVNNTGDSEEFKKYFNRPLERIILYIDDLDRCSDDRVVQVLEAVNLLMAYPLFIVVVGVDPRWVKNALRKKYDLQFNNEGIPDRELIEPSGYLEKIFQVPFQLKSATGDNVKHMLKNLAESHPVIKPSNESLNYKEQEELESNTHEVDQGPDIESDNWKQKLPIEEAIHTKESIEALKFSEKEIELLQRMSDILGSNPRALKRFVNIYRVIKAHEDFKYTDASEEGEVLTVLFLIALPLGKYKYLAKPFEEWLHSTEDLFTTLSTFLMDDRDARYNLYNAVEYVSDLLLDKGIEDFNKHYQFIKRFTFTNI
ncbi:MULTISPECIES: P-loop NTPase fold protein [unclassified Leeuwenhoekiella]|uniref:P-loop NTPase fold protein n=1 Tax=unclassified Leeuwenhoekiella TaxID=2615029 RepID=UPI000C59C666|nr:MULTISPECIES: P-loop NTPase fold protein [unclassified Leeuwenhoekiella]MAW94497.1 hypothetical protein [Leeuwenhoekiella sp.]MAW96993.1 hypothetical protein [Leeuwenhoekiella sp.]MBA80728.1 hypothetical protein [Leeuwenhoekiella sp.]|tara:strand:- start:2697 stop:5984 length:3288 start_codon:yes stop_codon:yes gene_type:complete